MAAKKKRVARTDPTLRPGSAGLETYTRKKLAEIRKRKTGTKVYHQLKTSEGGNPYGKTVGNSKKRKKKNKPGRAVTTTDDLARKYGMGQRGAHSRKGRN